MRPFIISALISLMTPTLLWAEDSVGAITGAIGELEINVPIWTEQSDFYGNGNSGGVSIMTRSVARDEGLGTLRIGFEGSDFLRGNFTNFEISIGDTKAEGNSEYFAVLDHDLQISITRAEMRDGSLSLAGTVQGTLIWRQLMPISERKEDPSRQLPAELAFDVVVTNEM